MVAFTRAALALSFFSLQASANFFDASKYVEFGGGLTDLGKQLYQQQQAQQNNHAREEPSNMNVSFFPQPYAREEVPAQFFKNLGSKRTIMKYGPYTVPSMDQNNGMGTFLTIGAQMPCTACKITYMQAGLEYPNGTYANANTSLWLHHTVMINTAEADTVCGRDYYGVGQRWFASGNERTPANLCLNGEVPVGYDIGALDMQMYELELMNQQMGAQDAVLTLEMEYLPLTSLPMDFYSTKPIWLDIAGCDIPSDMPPKNNNSFTYSTNTSYVPTDWTGALVGMGAHLHDGGTHLNITNHDDPLCNSEALYGGPGYVGPSMDMMGSMPHIGDMTSCYAPYIGMVQKNDSYNVEAFYDFTEHPGMTNTDGSLMDIMGIAIVYAAENMTAEQMAKYVGPYTPNDQPPQNGDPGSPAPAASSTGMTGMGAGSKTTMSMATMTGM